jgi:hypothetical protein
MSLDNLNPRIWAARLYENLHKAQVFENCVNTEYEGEIKNFGDSVKISQIGPITLSDYTKNTSTITPEHLSAASLTLVINKAKSWSFEIDDIDRMQNKPKAIDAAMREAAYAVANDADSAIAGLYASGGQTITASVSSATILSTLTMINQRLDEKNVPRDGRWVVMTPWGAACLQLAGIIRKTDNSDLFAKQAGFITDWFGLKIYVSNNLTNVTASDTVPVDEWMAGHTSAIAYASQMSEIEGFRSHTRMADVMRGLHVYGYKVLDANRLLRVTATRVAETAI